MSVSQYCNRDVITIAADASAQEAAKLMRKHRAGTLVVIAEQDGKRLPLGLLGESALVIEVMARNVDPKTVTAADLMHPIEEGVREDEAIWTVVERMRERNQRRLPVIDKDGALLGLLAADDILGLLAAGLVDIATLTRDTVIDQPAKANRSGQKKTARKTSKRSPKKETAKQQESTEEKSKD